MELTSAREDGSWTWRVAGARQPRGEVASALVPAGAKVGDVLRVEAEFELDGILVTAVVPTRDKKRAEPERLQLLGPPESRPAPPAAREAGPARPDRRPRRDGEVRDAPPRRDGQGREARARREGDDRAARPARTETGGGGSAEHPPPRGQRPDRRQDRPRQVRPARSSAERPDQDRPVREAAPKPRRLNPGDVHRSAVLAGLPPEHRPIAEQVLRGGIPAVRHAVEAQNTELRGKGEREVHAEPLVALAEQLLPALKQAEWRDRAEAAVKMLDDLSLRDLRSLVAGADAAARDDETRRLAGVLREALEHRLTQQRERWVNEISTALDEGRLVRALRVSARPPDPATRFPSELALRMSEAASSAMGPDVASERWAILLEAVADSPVRRAVKPAGLPAAATPELLQAARQASGRVPALAPLLGIDMPPPPGPPRPARRAPGPTRPRRPPGSLPARARPAPEAPPGADAPPPDPAGLAPAEAPAPARPAVLEGSEDGPVPDRSGP